MQEQVLQRLGQRGFGMAGCLAEEGIPRLLLHHAAALQQLESGRHLRLQRETTQDLLAKGVEGGGTDALRGMQQRLVQCSGLFPNIAAGRYPLLLQ